MYSDKEYLQAALDNGMIDMTTLQAEMDMAERKKYLAMHEHRVWQGANGFWFTYLQSGNGRRMIKRRNRQDIDECIIEYYRELTFNPTIKDTFYMWLDEKLETKEIVKGTYDKYENDFKRFFDSFGKFKIKQVDEDMLETFIRKTIGEKELTNKAYSGLRTLLIGIFKYAKRKKYTDISISTFFKDLQLSSKVFKQNPKDKKTAVFSESETEIITTHLKQFPSLIHYGMLLCFQTGIRVGELVALKYSDVEGDTVHIQRQEIKYKKNGKTVVEIVEYTKTEAGNRYIILTENAKETLRLMKQYSYTDFIMERDKRIRCSTINHELYRVCKRCNLAPRSMHKIRRTYATTLIDAGVDDAITMEMLGHSDITTTRKFYYYCRSDEAKKKAQINRAITC